MAASSNFLPWFETRRFRDAPHHEAQRVAHSISISLELVEAKLAPALARGLLVFLRRPRRWRISGPAKVRIRIVVEVDGGIDQHTVPLARAEQRGIAVALAGRGIKAKPESRRQDPDCVLAGIDSV